MTNRFTILAPMLFLGACGGGSGNAAGTATADASALALALPASSSTSTPITTAAATPDPLVLGVATHFQQGWPLSAMQIAHTVGATAIRDEVSWGTVERSPGQYDFSDGTTRYLDDAAAAGLAATVLLQWGNVLYDQSYTPYTDAGRAAFARFAVALVDRFPSVHTIEIGNEFNAQNFVSGPVKTAGYGERQLYHAKMLKAVYDAVKARHPDVQILGGATHSIPVGYLKVLFDAGALASMDGVAIHPYTTEPEQLGKQIAVLRQAMGANIRPIHVTEYARELDSEVETADYLVKMTTALAEARVASADWYALRQEGPADAPWYKKVALSRQDGTLTPVGRGYQLMAQRVLARGQARRVAIDDFTYGYLFGTTAMVLWGEPRDLAFDGEARFYNSRGEEIAQPEQIDPASPVVIIATAPIVLGKNLRLGASTLVADSFDQFDYTNSAVASAAPGRWSYYDFAAGRQVFEPLSGFGGGEVSWTAWTPYISDAWRRPLAIAAESLLPANFGSGSAPDIYRNVLRYTIEQDQRVRIDARWTVGAGSSDGVDLTVSVNGKVIDQRVISGAYRTDLRDIVVRRGDRIDFMVGPNVSAAGDNVTYRVKLYRQ